VHDRKGAGLDIRENAEDGVLTGGRVDVDPIARNPSEKRRFRTHSQTMAWRINAANYFAGESGRDRTRASEQPQKAQKAKGGGKR